MTALALVHSQITPTAVANRDVMIEALSIVAGVTPKNGDRPILSNVRIERTSYADRCITLRTTDLDMEIAVNVRANVSEEFATTVPARLLLDVLRRTPDVDQFSRVALEMLDAEPEMRQATDADGAPVFDDEGRPVHESTRRNSFVSDRLRVRLGRADFTLSSLPVDNFPSIAPFDDDPRKIVLAGSAFWNGLDSVMAAISTEETRYYLNGVYLHEVGPGTLAATATDGHRLLRQEIRGITGLRKNKPLPGIIVPRAAVALLHRLLSGKSCPEGVDVYLDETKFAVNWGPIAFITKTIDGTFPDYARVIPTQNDKIAVANGPRLARSLAAVTALSSERGRAVKCSFEAGKLTFTVYNPECGSGVIDMDCRYDGEPVEIGFNAGYLSDMVSRAAPDRGDVTIKIADAQSPTLFTGSISGWSGVLMPMRV